VFPSSGTLSAGCAVTPPAVGCTFSSRRPCLHQPVCKRLSHIKRLLQKVVQKELDIIHQTETLVTLAVLPAPYGLPWLCPLSAQWATLFDMELNIAAKWLPLVGSQSASPRPPLRPAPAPVE